MDRASAILLPGQHAKELSGGFNKSVRNANNNVTVGVFQDSCHIFCHISYAAFCVSSTIRSRSGFSATEPIGVQLRVEPDQRPGCFFLAKA